MAVVFLKGDWFDPNAKLWSARNNPHEMEEELIEFLPSGTVVDGVPNDAEKKPSRKEVAEKKESGEQALAEKEREAKVVQKAESEHNDKAHAAVVHKTATPPKL